MVISSSCSYKSPSPWKLFNPWPFGRGDNFYQHHQNQQPQSNTECIHFDYHHGHHHALHPYHTTTAVALAAALRYGPSPLHDTTFLRYVRASPLSGSNKSEVMTCLWIDPTQPTLKTCNKTFSEMQEIVSHITIYLCG